MKNVYISKTCAGQKNQGCCVLVCERALNALKVAVSIFRVVFAMDFVNDEIVFSGIYGVRATSGVVKAAQEVYACVQTVERSRRNRLHACFGLAPNAIRYKHSSSCIENVSLSLT